LFSKASRQVHNNYISLVYISGQSLPLWKSKYCPDLHMPDYMAVPVSQVITVYAQCTRGKPGLKNQRFSMQPWPGEICLC